MKPIYKKILIFCLLAAAAFFLYYFLPPLFRKPIVGWREHFTSIYESKGVVMPVGWKFQSKPGTPRTTFYVVKKRNNGYSYLHMEADNATGTLLCNPKGIDLDKTPVLRWKWMVEKFPEGADSRAASTDDQAIGIYVGTGSLVSQKSISYRWDTDTPKGSEGQASYGGGMVKVKWFTIRNKDDGENKWLVDERDFLDDFEKAWGFRPEKVYIGVCCNSQYTGTSAAADLNWIEFNGVAGQEGEHE